MKKADVLFGCIGVLLIVFGVVLAVRRHTQNSIDCTAAGGEHRLTVSGDRFSAKELTVKRCDRIVIADTGSEDYDFAFGTHEHHLSYPGFTMQSLQPGQYFQLDAVQSGTFMFHDHLRDNARIELTIH